MEQRTAAFGIMITSMILLILSSIMCLQEKPAIPVKQKTYVQKQLEVFIKDKYIAEVISKTKYPYLIAAMAKVESDFRPRAVGDGGKAYGMFQIWPSLHGWRGDTVEQQAAHCEEILSKLIDRHGIAGGVRRYNGSGHAARKYKSNVLAIANHIKAIKV